MIYQFNLKKQTALNETDDSMALLLLTDPHQKHDEENRVSISRLCAEPQPVIQRLPRESNIRLIPEYAIVNKCRCGDVCDNSSLRCVAVRSVNVSKPFLVNAAIYKY